MNQVTALQYFTELMRPRVAILEQLAGIRKAFDNIDTAHGGELDIVGERFGEPRNGLIDDDYRKIIRTRKIAIYGLKSYPGIEAGWNAILGPDAINKKIIYLPPATVMVVGEIPVQPNELFIQRAGPVVGALVPAGYQITALIAQPNALQWDEDNLFWDDNDWAYALDTRLV